MLSKNFKIFFALLFVSLIGYTYSTTCQCFCCKHSPPSTACYDDFKANITVDSCYDCKLTLCATTYNESCPKINSNISTACEDSSGGNSGHSLFLSVSSTFMILMVVFQMLVYEKIGY